MTLATLFQDVEECFRRPNGVNITETEEAFILEAITAGVKPKDINISFEKGTIRIDARSEKYGYSYLLPVATDSVDMNATPEATCEDGILKISHPKLKVTKPIKIAIKGA